MKTLLGKNNYLFLQNDSSDELNIHLNNKDLISNTNINIYLKYTDKLLLIIIPGKPIIYKDYLPFENINIYRPGFEKYKLMLNNNVLDTLDCLENIESFYKTDTHPNLLGIYQVYKKFINTINTQFNFKIDILNINIEYKECELSQLGLGIGDLTWPSNKGELILDSIQDRYYYSNDINTIYNKYIINDNKELQLLDYNLNNITSNFNNKILGWSEISNNIIYYNNLKCNNKFKAIIFCDSFITQFVELFIYTLSETYIIKNTFNEELIEKIKPDYIFEFRAERFLR